MFSNPAALGPIFLCHLGFNGLLCYQRFTPGIAFMLLLNLYVTICYEALAKTLVHILWLSELHDCATAPWMGVPVAIFLNWLLNKCGAYKINWNPERIREKFGFWGDPIVMGIMVGLVLGILGT